ncbi:hypothetical protein [Nonomuraea dietziae]|uniref:hypothetical protein n=1 Tax=Nonomuraea dietziae TaxID=65515 RepID=UPI0031CF3D4E
MDTPWWPPRRTRPGGRPGRERSTPRRGGNSQSAPSSRASRSSGLGAQVGE